MKDQNVIGQKSDNFHLRELQTEEVFYLFGLVALPLFLLAAYFVTDWVVPRLRGAGCIFWERMGIYCPGCGGTRALTALIHGHFLLSLWYHPLIGYCAVIYGIFMLSHTMERLHVPFIKGMKCRIWPLYGALIVGNWIMKNLLKFCFGVIMF